MTASLSARRYTRRTLNASSELEGREANDTFWCEEFEGQYWRLSSAPWKLESTRCEPLSPAVVSERLVCPAEPSKIICVGRNYADHAKELGNEVPKEPLLFFKPPSSLLPPSAEILVPKESRRVDHEAELTLVVGKTTRRASLKEAAQAIFGFTAANDVTARDIQRSDSQFTRGKGFDTFCPVGPAVIPLTSDADFDMLSALEVRCLVNGETRQSGSTSLMLHDCAALVSYVSQVMTLLPGDLILTGTPAGVGPLESGDTVLVELARNDETLLQLENSVAHESY